MSKTKGLVKQHWQLLVLFVLTLFIVWPLFLSGYFSHHDDLQVMRIFEMRKCFEDLQLPCRWVPDMGYGNGFPLYNYYSAFPYYLGGILSYILGFIGAAKALFFIALFCGGFGMYYLAKEIYDDKNLALLSAVLYTFAPYRSLDSYVRGAVAESFALSIAPIIFYFMLRFFKQSNFSNFLSIVISLALFLLTHNIMSMFFVPVLSLWGIGLFVFKNKWKNLVLLGLSFLLAIGLASFFLLPAFLEKDLVQTDSLVRGDLNFRVHFVAVPQLFLDHSWGYGASVFGPNDSLSFQIGWPHWIMVFISIVCFGFIFILKRKVPDRIASLATLLFGLVYFAAVFMTHNLSAPLWERIHLLQYTQFPWRFLSLIIFAASIVGVFWVRYVPLKIRYLVVLGCSVLVVLLNVSFFKPEKFFEGMTDDKKLSGAEWTQQQKSSILDYLPKTASEPREQAPSLPLILSGKADVLEFNKGTNWFQGRINVTNESDVEFPIFDFPEWRVWANGKIVMKKPDNHIGRIEVNLSKGDYTIVGRLENTNIRSLANSISILSLFCLVGIYLYDKHKRIFS